MIESDILLAKGAKSIYFAKDAWIFRQGEQARFYYQVFSGQVKMSNFNAHGQEFVQGLFSEGQSFGEPPLLAGLPYPASALATSDARILKLGKDKFLNLLLENPNLNLLLSEILAKRLHYKAVMAAEISSQEPEHRILTLLQYLKRQFHHDNNIPYAVDLTRQQIADMTGLRVETVIRAIKKLEKTQSVSIKNRKVYL